MSLCPFRTKNLLSVQLIPATKILNSVETAEECVSTGIPEDTVLY